MIPDQRYSPEQLATMAREICGYSVTLGAILPRQYAINRRERAIFVDCRVRECDLAEALLGAIDLVRGGSALARGGEA